MAAGVDAARLPPLWATLPGNRKIITVESARARGSWGSMVRAVEQPGSGDLENKASTPALGLAPELRRRLKPLDSKPAGTLLVHEIYRSIQGESTFAGLPCVFVRLTACQMRCGYCDTVHAFTQGRVWALEDVVAEVERLGDPLVELTGGEPLLQPEAYPLMTRLLDLGKTVLLETGGGIDTRAVDPRVRIILDVKTPGSGESEGNVWSNLDRIRPTDEVKFVLLDRGDFDWALEVIEKHALTGRCGVLVSAVHGALHPRTLAEWILESRLPLRLQLQLHKLLWGADARGV